MKVGDLVRVRLLPLAWAHHEIGLVLEFTKRLYIPAAVIFVLGEVAQFDLSELEAIDESR